MNGRACSFVRASAVPTRTGPGRGLRTPYRTGCTARVNAVACCYISRVYVPYGVRLG